MEIGSSYYLRSVHSGIRGRGRVFGKGNNSLKKPMAVPTKQERARREWIPHIVTAPSRGPVWLDEAREMGPTRTSRNRSVELNFKTRGRGLRVKPS